MLSAAAMAAPPQQQQLPPLTPSSSSSIPSSTIPAKENNLNNSNRSSSSTCIPSAVQTSSAFSSRYLRAPLSPIHHNCPPQLSRFSEQSSTAAIATTPSAASRRYSRDPSRPAVPSHLSRSPPHGLRSPSSNSISRKLLRDGFDTRSNSNRFQKDRNTGPPPMAHLASRAKSSIPPPRPKRQTQQQLPQRISQDPFSVDHVPSFNNGWVDKPESEQSAKPGRRKWRRYPRDVVLRSLRGDRDRDHIERKHSTVSELSENKTQNSENKKAISPSGVPFTLSRLSETVSRPPLNRLTDAEFALSNLKIADAEPRRSLEKKSNLYSNTKLHQASSRYGDTKDKSRYSSSTNRSTESAVSFRDSHSTLFSSSDDSSSLSSSMYKSNVSRNLAARAGPSKPPLSTPAKTQVEIPQTCFETETMFTFSTAPVVLTPPPKIHMSPSLERSLNLTPDDRRQRTPPMQSTQSPDFIKREGMRGIVLPMDGKCYAAPGFVKDRRKCKPRGVLTIDGGLDVTSSEDSEISLKISQSSQLIGIPPVASVEWMLDGKKPVSGDASPEIVSISTDICRMSFPKLTPQPLDGLPEQEDICKSFTADDDVVADPDVLKDGPGCSTQDSMTMSGYEWGANSSQGVHSSCRSDISSVNPRRSIMFEDDECLYRSHQVRIDCTPEKLKPNVAHSVLFDDGIDKSDLPNMFSDDEGGDGLSVQGLPKPEGSPPFEYLMSMKSGPNMSFKKDEDDASWAKCVPEEVNLMMSGPLGLKLSRSGQFCPSLSSHDLAASGQFCSSLSSQDLAASLTSAGPLAYLHDADAIQKLDCNPLEIAAELQEPSTDISSRIAMAKLLCNITANYLDNIVTTLGNGDSASKLKDVVSELAPEILDEIGPDHSSIIAGRQKMAECCSLLRGLSLETATSKETTASNLECFDNQPSHLMKDDIADSCMVRFGNVQESTCNFATEDWYPCNQP